MIQSYILIELSNGKNVKYVRDIVTDTLGVNKNYYGYKGAGHQNLGLMHIAAYKPHTLREGIVYDFKLTIDGGTETTYSITPSEATFKNLIHLLNLATNNDGAMWFITPHGDIRCMSTSNNAGTSISLDNGETNDLFSSLPNFFTLAPEVAGDQFFDQDSAGKIKNDFDTLISNASLEDRFLTFPESTPSTILIRKNFSESDNEFGNVISSIKNNLIANIRVIEQTIWD